MERFKKDGVQSKRVEGSSQSIIDWAVLEFPAQRHQPGPPAPPTLRLLESHVLSGQNRGFSAENQQLFFLTQSSADLEVHSHYRVGGVTGYG